MPNRPLQHRPFGFELLHRVIDARDRQSREVVAAAALLGAEHRLVRTLDLISVMRRQLLLSSLALAGGGMAFAAGASWATTITLAAAIVALAFACALAVLRSLRHGVVRELFIDGWGDLPFGPLARERQRLASPHVQARVARALARLPP